MFRSMFFSVVLTTFNFALPQTAFSGDLEQVFEQLKDSGEDYRPDGAVCEQVARLDIERDYPRPSFQIVTGISYANAEKILGELDVVVFDARNGHVVSISEVKCWKNFKSAFRKASEQMRRFQRYVDSEVPLRFCTVKKPSYCYEKNQFRFSAPFTTISQSGGHSAGFDQTLDFSLEEMRGLRLKLLTCQARGECRRPRLEGEN
jgi:hypothetical protein